MPQAQGALPSGTVTLRLRATALPPVGATLYRTHARTATDPTAGWDSAFERTPVALTFRGAAGTPLTCEFRTAAAAGTLDTPEVLTAARGNVPLHEVLKSLFERMAPKENLDEFEGHITAGDLPTDLFLPPRALKALRRRLIDQLSRPLTAPAPVMPPPRLPQAGPEDTTERPAPPVALRLWQAELWPVLASFTPSGGFILPITLAQDSRVRSDPRVRGYWLPPWDADTARLVADRIRDGALTAPGRELLCLSWEAFALRERLPEAVVRLDGTFPVANARCAAVVRAAGLAATAYAEAPYPPAGMAVVCAWNPLVSLTHFPGPTQAGPFVNSHGDRFHRLPLTATVAGLFLERTPRPNALAEARLRRASLVQVDVFAPPGQTVVTAAEVARWLEQSR